MSSLRIVFFGTPAFAVPALRALIASPHLVVAAVTQPDRPRGRGHKVTPGAVKLEALQGGIPVLQPDRLSSADFVEAFAGLQSDLGVVAAYGKLLPDALLAGPRLGMINVHASLLPRWRGAAPVHRAILAGDRATGVTIMRVVKKLDAGPMLATIETAIGDDETSAELEVRLAGLGAPLLVDTVDRLAAGPVTERPQDESAVTYAHRLERRESAIDWRRPARDVRNQIRGLQPWPLATAVFLGRRTMLLRSEVVDERARESAPGTVDAVLADGLDVATAPGAIRLREIQTAGKAPMTVAAFLRGHPVRVGEVFRPLETPPA